MGKGNKHASKRVYKKNWKGSKNWREAQKAKKQYHRKKEKTIARKENDMTYEKVKQLALDYSNRNAHFSFHKSEDPNHKAVVEMGEAAAPHLFRVMFEHPETTHFAYNVIPLLIDPPKHIVERMNTEAISKVGGSFVGLDVSKMTEIYKQWAEELV